MVAYSFEPRFIEPIVTQAKRQTIRADRRRHARPGEILQLYTGMRTKWCRLIGIARCTSVWPISIDVANARIEYGDTRIERRQSLDAFARSSGFPDWSLMQDFWIENRGPLAGPWTGVFIRWQDFKDASADG